MNIVNRNRLFAPLHATVLADAASAKEFSARSGAESVVGDEVRTYGNPDGLFAQAILSPSRDLCAVCYAPEDGFLWGQLMEAGGRALLVADGDPCVMVDLSDLSVTQQQPS